MKRKTGGVDLDGPYGDYEFKEPKRRVYKVLIPEVMADCVSAKHSHKLVELFYRFSKKFPDNQKGRDMGYMFMHHWLEGYELTGKWIDSK